MKQFKQLLLNWKMYVFFLNIPFVLVVLLLRKKLFLMEIYFLKFK